VECGTFDLLCHTEQAVSSAWDQMVTDIADGAAELVVTMTTWWVTTDSIDPTDPAVLSAQSLTRDLVAIILVGSVLVQAMRLIISRKGEPALLVATGLIRYAVTCGLGLVALQTALRAADALSVQFIGGATDSFALYMRDALHNDPERGFVLLLIAVIAAVLAVVQWVLMALRQAGLLVLAAMLPLAAAGSLTKSTRGWLDKMIVWLIAMVAYKPAAALIYAIGFQYLSSPAANNDGSIAALMTGIVVLLLAVVAMPVLLKFFFWTGAQIGGASGGGSGFLGAAGAIAMTRTSSGRGAVDRAADIDATGPGTAPTAGSGASAAPPAGAAQTGARGGAASMLGTAALVGSAAASAARKAGEGMTGPAKDES
jgi:hypothetical protein